MHIIFGIKKKLELFGPNLDENITYLTADEAAMMQKVDNNFALHTLFM